MDHISSDSNIVWSSQSIINERMSTSTSSHSLSSPINEYNYYASQISTPLDPLLKHLKKTYAASAGPKDVLGTISKEDMDRWLSSDDGDSSDADDWMQSGSSEKEIFTRKSSIMGVDNVVGSVQYQLPQMPAFDPSIIHQHQHPDAPPYYFQQQQPLLNNSSLIDAHIPPTKPSRRQERRMPDFCYAPTTHVDNLLQTMPHLRHLSNGPTDLSGLGISESKSFFHKLLNATTQSNTSVDPSLENVDYATSMLRHEAYHRASMELASFLRTLSNEMPHDKFIAVESEVYSKLFSLVHSKTDRAERLAGVAALDALLEVPSFDQDKKTIRFGNNLSNGLKAATADFEFLYAVAKALGKMASSAANVDRVEFEIGRSLEWLRSDRGDRRLAAALVLRELAREAPTAFYSKTQQSKLAEGAVKDGGLLAGLRDLGLGGTNEFLDHIFPVLSSKWLIVRVCAADALSECIKILMERQASSMTAPLCNLFSDMMTRLVFDPSFRSNNDNMGDDATAAINAHGSLLAVGTFLDHTQNFIMPRE
jgi:hypothetical protein